MISNISNDLNSFNLPQKTACKDFSITSKFNKMNRNQAYYSKKGEPIYQKDMDYDKDGIVSLDEFQQYCKENNADIKQLLKNWLIYHSSKDVDETVKELKEEKEEEFFNNSKTIYAKKGDSKYQSAMDYNDDGKITYKEYLEYCRQNAQEEKKNSKSEIDNSSDEFKIINKKSATDEYSTKKVPDGMVEVEA